MTDLVAISLYAALVLCLVLLFQVGIASRRMVRLLAEMQATSSASFAVLKSLDNVPMPDCTSLDTVFFGGRKYRLVEPAE